MTKHSSLFTRAALSATCAISLFACMRPPHDQPGVESQAAQHPERNIAMQHTVPQDSRAIPAAESPDDPDSPGTTRTPPAAPARPMDEEVDSMPGAQEDPSTAQFNLH
jgi:hypothetical protein